MKFLVINIFFATLRLGVKIVIRDLSCSFAAPGDTDTQTMFAKTL
jgi:hypothetical protein